MACLATEILYTFIVFNCIAFSESWMKYLGNITVSFNKGAISVKNDANSFNLAFHQLYELADNGETRVGLSGDDKHRLLGFNEQQYKFSSEKIIDVAGKDVNLNIDRNITAFNTKISTTLIGPDVSFDVDLYMFDNTTFEENLQTGERFHILNGTVKVVVTLGSWKFCGHDSVCMKSGEKETGEFLELYLRLDDIGRDTPDSVTRRGYNFHNQAFNPETFDCGGSDVTFSKNYIQNFTSRRFPSPDPELIADTKLIVMRFPRFPNEYPVSSFFYINVDNEKFVKSSSKPVLPMMSLVLSVSVVWMALL